MLPHAGHSLGFSMGLSWSLIPSSTRPMISGITSFDLRSQTLEPMATLFLKISSQLLRVALCTVTPPISIGSSRAIGVTLPVLPTFQIISFRIVVTSSAANLYAKAHLGNLPVFPR